MKIFVCNPSYFNVSYTINPWMNIKNQVTSRLASQQWQKLINLIHLLRHEVLEINPVENLPDMVFTANAGLIIDKKVILSNFLHSERRPESALFKKWFLENDFEVVELDNLTFEGAGDVLISDNDLFCGYGFRSDQRAYFSLIEHVCPKRMILCELVDSRFYHLDTCFCPLGNGSALIFPSAFESDSLNLMKKHIKFLEVSEDEALQFACNSVVLGGIVIMPSGCDKTRKMLESAGFEVFECDMSEFLKSGGACKCLTLNLG